MNETVAILAEEEVLLISAFHAGQTESNAVEEVVHRRQFVTLYDWTDAIVCEATTSRNYGRLIAGVWKERAGTKGVDFRF